jgi:mannosyltransferase OCH1-like enzyme
MKSPMIPKLLHQTAKTADIPERWRGYQQKLRALHPDWEYRLWTDADNLEFVKREYPDFYDVFVKLPKNIMRADVIRYLLLYRLGGLYMDLDYEMLRPFDLLEHEAVLPWEIDGERIGNALMAAVPGHPFFKRVIDDLKANPPLGEDVDVLTSTGPHFLSRILREASGAALNIHTPTRPLFNPPSPRSPRQYRAILREGIAYGIHHCTGSWREYTVPQRVRNQAVALVRRLFT